MVHVEKFSFLDTDDLCANAYVVSDVNNNCVIIDPSTDNDCFINFINKNNLNLKAILLTHGHFDHIRGVKRMMEKFHAPIFIHELDRVMLNDSYLNGSFMMNERIELETEVEFVKDNQVLKLLDDDIKVIHTPYHTKGSVCYYFINNNLLFSGDTLFKNSIGRDDLPNSAPSEFDNSFRKIKSLAKNCKVYPGHGNNTTIGDELNYNYFLTR